jgi:hypothetical protein
MHSAKYQILILLQVYGTHVHPYQNELYRVVLCHAGRINHRPGELNGKKKKQFKNKKNQPE